MSGFVAPPWALDGGRIAIVGAGGNGSAMVDGLASLVATLMMLGHPGFEVTVFDGDTVSDPNIGRQRFCSADLGQNKAIVLVHRVNLFHGLQWRAVPRMFQPDEAPRFDLVVGCVDRARTRVELGAQFGPRRRHALWLDLGNAEYTGQVILGGSNGRDYLPTVLDLHPELAEVDDSEAPSCSVEEAVSRQSPIICPTLTCLARDLLWHLIRDGALANHHGYHVDLSNEAGHVRPLAIDPVVWSTFGFEPELAGA